MKIFSVITFSLFTMSSFAQIPASIVMKSILSNGTFQGKNCSVSVVNGQGAVSLAVTSTDGNNVATIVDNTRDYQATMIPKSITARLKLGLPYYLNGGVRLVSVEEKTVDTVEVSISDVLLDHNGNDASTFVSCSISK